MNHARRIVVTGPIPPPNGGMALQTRQLMSELMAEGWQATLVPSNAPYKWTWVANIPVLRAVFRLVTYVRHLRQVLKNAELVHVMANSGWSWYLLPVPAIHIAHYYGVAVVVNYRGGLAESFLARAAKQVAYSLKRSDALVVPTEFLQKVFHQFGWLSDIIPNILDERVFRPFEILNEKLVIVVTRNLEALYDNESAIRAFAIIKNSIPEAELVLCGEGPEKNRLQALTQELAIDHSVQFAGRLNREQLLSTLKKARVVLNPSTADNSPNSLIEAMACGLPIVSTNAGGIPVLCRDQQEALLVNVADVHAMASAIMRVHADGTLRETLIANGLKRARVFYWSSVRQQLFAIYEKAIVHRSRRYA